MRIADVVANFLGIVVPAVVAGCYPDDILATRVDGGIKADQDCLQILNSAIASSPSSRCGPLPAPTGQVICVVTQDADGSEQ